MWKKKKCFLDMQNAKIIRYSIVLVDNVFSEIKMESMQKELTLQGQNPFMQLNSLALKGALGLSFTEITKPQSLDKQYQYGNFQIYSQFFPPKFSIIQNNIVDKNETISMVEKIINFANLSNNIGKIGINFDAIIEKDLIVKDAILKEDIAKEFSGVAITLEKQINEVQKLNLKIAGTKNTETNQNAIFINANFESTVTTENTIDKILKADYLSILEPKVNAVFGKL